MENKSLKDLKGNAKNPRTINKEDYKNLVQSIKRFGDLSGIVFNIETQQLAGGHQRQKAFAEIGADDIVITQRLPEKNSVGTTAVGYVMFNGERYAYREVSWSPEFEKAANVAANRIQGEFDLDLLAEITYEISQAENASDLLNLTGQTEDEIDRLMKMSGAIDSKPEDEPGEQEPDKLEFALSADQREVVEEAIGHIKATRELQATKSSNINGAALFVMAQDYLNKLHAEQEARIEQANETTTTAIPTES